LDVEEEGDPDFSLDRFPRDMGVNRSQLQRKIKGLKAGTPMEFLKYLQLKRVIQLLRDS
jgi:hypothetical protein